MTSLPLTDFTYFRGRVALAEILGALGIRPGDEVALQAFTCSAVPEAILSLGAKPIYVDVEAHGYTMDPRALESKLTSRTRALVVQHTFGLPADLSGLHEVAVRRELPVVEDCAHTLATAINGRLVGTWGVAAFYSFEASKPVFAGLGGSAIVNEEGLRAALARRYPEVREPSTLTQAQLLLMFIAHRLVYRPTTYWWVRSVFRRAVALGLIKGNYNALEVLRPADDFHRSMGTIQRRLLGRALKRLAAQTAHRRWVAEEYRRRMTNPFIEHPPLRPGADPVFGRYPLLSEDRGAILALAPAAKVEVADFYSTPVHPFRAADLGIVGYEPGSCPNAEWLSERVISLPTNPMVGERQIDRTARFFNNLAG